MQISSRGTEVNTRDQLDNQSLGGYVRKLGMVTREGTNRFIILAIKFILDHPKSIILLPMLMVFILGYDVAYDFTILPLNNAISQIYLQWQMPSVDCRQLNCLLDPSANYSLTRLSICNNGLNMLTANVFSNINNLLQSANLTDEIVLSPISQWNLIDNTSVASTEYLMSMVNHNSNFMINSLYFDNVDIMNHLIVKAKTLNFYILHKRKFQFSTLFNFSISNFDILNITTSNTNITKEFIDYYIRTCDLSWSLPKVLIRVFISILCLFFLCHLYLSISNLHKVRSSFGVLLAWTTALLISATSAIKVLELLHYNSVKSWSQIFEPINIVTMSIYILTVAMISSRNLIRIVADLSSNNYYSNSSKSYQKRLYKFFIGINNNWEISYKKLSIINDILKILHLNYNLLIPNASKFLLVDIFWLKLTEKFAMLTMGRYFSGNFLKAYSLKIGNYFDAVIITLLIDHGLQLTFLVGVILIDNHRRDVSSILDNNFEDAVHSTINDNDNEFNLRSANYISYLLLKNNPSRLSFRYKLGTCLTAIRHPTSLKSWFILLAALQSVNLSILLVIWSIYIPYNLYNYDNHFLNSLTIDDLSFDVFYLLEFMTLLILILSLSFISFKLSNYRKTHFEVPNNFQIELNDNKEFNTIDLNNHSLDILRLKSGDSSFLLSTGLDHKVLCWSPLLNSSDPLKHKPTDLSSTIKIDLKEMEFWPINFIDISRGGEYIILVNYKYNIIRCYCRLLLDFIWDNQLILENGLKLNKHSILESFFREKTVPGILKMKMIERLNLTHRRKPSEISLNGNFPRSNNENSAPERLDLEFIMVFESGTITTYSCKDGGYHSRNVLEEIYDDFKNLKLISAKKLMTLRVNDRIICQVSNNDLIVCVAVNNKWKFLQLNVKANNYNKETLFKPYSQMPTPMSMSRASSMNYNFESLNSSITMNDYNNEFSDTDRFVTNSKMKINKPIIATMEFVGMIIRVNNLVAELIDVQTGTIMKKFNVGHFKPSSFRVAHLEPTHCRFCGCASIQSLSVIYEDFDTKMLIIHTFKIQNIRSKNSICLRVERDPREIRCVGFSEVVEEQNWFENISKWEVTDVNMIIGVKREIPADTEFCDEQSANTSSIKTQNDTSKLTSLKQRHKKEPVFLSNDNANDKSNNSNGWEGFIITLNDGNLINYQIPNLSPNLISNRINCIEKYGFKSVAITFGNLIKILYLGNDKLIEENLYFNDLNKNKPINNELMFINKRRKK